VLLAVIEGKGADQPKSETSPPIGQVRLARARRGELLHVARRHPSPPQVRKRLAAGGSRIRTLSPGTRARDEPLRPIREREFLSPRAREEQCLPADPARSALARSLRTSDLQKRVPSRGEHKVLSPRSVHSAATDVSIRFRRRDADIWRPCRKTRSLRAVLRSWPSRSPVQGPRGPLLYVTVPCNHRLPDC
jgi:hypothetical protein